MRAAAVDLGTVRVGLAVADEIGLLAHPRPFLDGRDPARVLRQLAELCSTEGVDVFVVGLPRRLDGREGPAARKAREFAAALRKATPARVVLVDEWLTTREAKGRLRDQGLDERAQRSRIDSAAAAVLLQSFLDAERGPKP
ncbi:MAG: Holliday junction resolvase RuvX [Polyangiaceae bacterium]